MLSIAPSADGTPTVFRSVFQLEIAVKPEEGEAEVRYADGVVVAKGGLIASVFAAPNSNMANSNIGSVDVLMLDGSAIPAKVVAVDALHGLALVRADDATLPALELSDRSPVAKRRLDWNAVFREGQKTILYSRPLQIHRSKVAVGEVDDLCQVIDHASSSLTAARSGSALLSLDGRLVALMGRQPHWDVSPKSVRPRTKVAHAVPARIVRQLIGTTESQ